ncbi:BREX-1 system adenine-specific DNA-methyltransferase PglX [Clostridium estertheticum]|uniref:BREX-1 system adenine-specific DNA-methyltransferase PglX n=1 Tax=Clostridium estertheticum TaxID=238834 RepID=UPI001CF2022D|nr:BREX-1 system adenine-specific DNA-methyltransferase PglX [Clostridium estertheticum]MCB2341109.1 BREX-1 system adenine-specific DNA-methyltransferase PglX [Clostridium estertheticum]
MDKNKIKTYAIWARRKLISTVSERANRIGVTEKKIEDVVEVQGGFKLEGNDEIFKLSKDHRDKLVNQVNDKGFQQVMEEVAYTWFNRFMGLRYMEVNEYLPSGIRVLSSIVEGKTEPDVLTRVTEVIEELKLKSNYIYELLDSGKTEDRDEAYKHILVKQCNELGKIIPQMFEKISDYTELLLPDNLLEEGSVIRKIVGDIVEDNWKEEVEIIGWMYQYYISEKKDEVFAALKKNVKITKENIPAATQLFTPKWIVKYMVENSLGRLWLEGHPNEELQKEWKYYLEEADQEPQVEEELKKIRQEHSKLKPEDIKILDPCMGSGHILVYAFDVLYEIYKTAGYTEREIPRMILQNNLYGLDIDDRAAQLSSFALIMKARHYNRRLFREIEREGLELNLCSIQESNELTKGLGKEAIDYFVGDKDELRKDISYLIDVFNDAKEYGSILEVKEVNFEVLKERLNEIKKEYSLTYVDYKEMLLDKLYTIINQAEIMSGKYEVFVTNPPYMGNKSMNEKLKVYLQKNYSITKYDLFASFLEKDKTYLKRNGFTAMVNQHSWMFLNSYDKLRQDIITNRSICNMLHLGTRAFEEIGGEVVSTTTFVIRNLKQINNYLSSCVDLTNINNSNEKERKYLDICTNNEYNNIKNFNQNIFMNIPNNTLAYWISDNIIKHFKENQKIKDIADVKIGLSTTNNERFLRQWYEVSSVNIGFNKTNLVMANKSNEKWFPHNKGGSYRKWYGNQDYIVNWYNNGEEIKESAKGASGGRVMNPEYYFKEGISWSLTSAGSFGTRYFSEGFIFDITGPTIFANAESLKYICGLLCSKLATIFLEVQNQTLSITAGNVNNIPIILSDDKKDNINSLVDNCIRISKYEWNSFEISWDFKIHPLLKLLDKAEQFKLSSVFSVWETECEEAFEQLKSNEEELNRIFIDIYGLQDELTPEIEDKDITIRRADRERDIKSFISYAVGCMLGRYSADVSFIVEEKNGKVYGNYSDNIETLIYAGGDLNDKWNIAEKKVRKIEKDEEGTIISDSWTDAYFLPDADNVIPITEDEYFEDDIVSKFIVFVRLYFGAEDLEENLDFIADSIGRKASETARQAIRRYFIKDFYKDHLKVYKKRPIYWMFESGKNDGFKALVYMHRYNDQTVAKVRTDYLHTLQRKYEAEVQRQQLVVDSEEYTIKDRTVAKKKIDRIAKQIEECREYDQVVAHLANEKISIDLDDGVKVNYEKFQGVKFINSKEKEVKMDLLSKI